jgi:predicted HicB family RNase H-like nuclease
VHTVVTQVEKSNPGEDDNFLPKMKEFLVQADEDVTQLRRQGEQMNDKFSEACAKFGENPKDVTPEELFGTFKNFVEDVVKADRDNRRAKEELRKAAERAIAAEKKAKQTPGDKVRVQAKDGKDKGILDDLTAELESGTAFRGRRQNRRPPRGAHPRTGAVKVDSSEV